MGVGGGGEAPITAKKSPVFGENALISWPIPISDFGVPIFSVLGGNEVDMLGSTKKYCNPAGILCKMHLKYWNFPGIFVHTAPKFGSRGEKAHEQTPQKPNGGKVVWTEEKGNGGH